MWRKTLVYCLTCFALFSPSLALAESRTLVMPGFAFYRQSDDWQRDLPRGPDKFRPNGESDRRHHGQLFYYEDPSSGAEFSINTNAKRIILFRLHF